MGFWWIDRLADTFGAVWKKFDHGTGVLAKLPINGHSILLFKPGQLMNINGLPIAQCAHYFKIKPEEILLVYDDLDLPVGTIKLKYSDGHGGHNGVRNIQQHLDIKKILRLKIGIGRPEAKVQTSGYVLQQPSTTETSTLIMAMTKSVKSICHLLSGNIQKYQQDIAQINQGDKENGV